jgi:hypothetical protein
MYVTSVPQSSLSMEDQLLSLLSARMQLEWWQSLLPLLAATQSQLQLGQAIQTKPPLRLPPIKVLRHRALQVLVS